MFSTLNDKLSSVNWNIDIDDVQHFWNVFECLLSGIIDDIVPLVDFVGEMAKDKVPKFKI